MAEKRRPDVIVEAMVEKPKRGGSGGTETRWVPIGAAWRTDEGDYVGELNAQPTEWSFSAERRIYLRLRKDR